MHLKNILSSILLSLIIIFLPSCLWQEKYYKVSPEEFPQGKELPDHRKQIHDNLKTKAVYDQFATQAIFDVLYQSNDVITAYVDTNCLKRGKSADEKENLLDSELEKNKYWNSFFVLADVRDKSNIALTDKNTPWSFYIKTENGQNILPISIKEVELEPEYQYFFGHRFNLFKRSYHVKFPAKDLNGNDYFAKNAPFKLIISSAEKDVIFKWNVKDEDVKVKEEYYVKTSIEGKKHNWTKQKIKNEKHTRFKKVRRPKKEEEKILKDEDYYWI